MKEFCLEWCIAAKTVDFTFEEAVFWLQMKPMNFGLQNSIKTLLKKLQESIRLMRRELMLMHQTKESIEWPEN